MPWRSLPHQLNNRKFTKAVVFVHGLNGSARSWMGDGNRFVDRLSRIPAIYNHFGLFVFDYSATLAEFGPVKKLLALIPGGNEIAQKAKFNVDMRRIALQLQASLRDLLEGYKTIVLVGHGTGELVIKRALVEMGEVELKRIRLFISLADPPAAAAPVANPPTGAAPVATPPAGGAPVADPPAAATPVADPPAAAAPPFVPERTFADFTSKLTARFSRIATPPESCYIDADDTPDTVLEINDPNTHVAFNKVLALLLSLMPGDNG